MTTNVILTFRSLNKQEANQPSSPAHQLHTKASELVWNCHFCYDSILLLLVWLTWLLTLEGFAKRHSSWISLFRHIVICQVKRTSTRQREMSFALKNLTSRLFPRLIQNPAVPSRSYATPKRFYKNTSVLYSDGKFEVTLDNRKLKTPSGAPFVVKSEPLAIAVAAEWNNQKKNIDRSTMHLTALCSTALDNPNKLQQTDIVNYLMNYIATDTVLFQSDAEPALYELQSKEWDPLIKWFNDRYETNVAKTLDISMPQISAADKMNISKYLVSHSLDALHGFVFAVDTLKSIILAFAVINQHITPERAVHLSRLEEEYQLGYWGRVEWAHDLSQQDLQARLAAAVLFVHFNLTETVIKEKLVI